MIEALFSLLCPAPQERAKAFSSYKDYLGKDITSLVILPVWIMQPFTMLQAGAGGAGCCGGAGTVVHSAVVRVDRAAGRRAHARLIKAPAAPTPTHGWYNLGAIKTLIGCFYHQSASCPSGTPPEHGRADGAATPRPC